MRGNLINVNSKTKHKPTTTKFRKLTGILAIIYLLFFIGFTLNAQQYAKLVNPEIGSQGSGLGCGFNYLGATYPFGMLQFTPSFFSPQKGFVVNQLSGAGCPHMGNFPVLPIAGKLTYSPKGMEDFKKYRTINQAHAGFLSVDMADKTTAKLTVNKRAGIANFMFDESEKFGTVIIGAGISSTSVSNAMVKITSNKTCEGFAEGGDFCWSSTKYRVYFVAEFDRPATTKGTWIKEELLVDANHAYGKDSGAYFTFDTHSEVNYFSL